MNWDIEHAYGWSSKEENDSNRLKAIEQYKVTISEAEASIWFKALLQRATPGTEISGRIVGPRCLFAETSECVSPLRSVRDKAEQPALIVRTAFPNPSFWNPQTPLLYRVVMELWQDGHRCNVCGFDLGFRMMEMGRDTVLVNQKPFFVHGMSFLPQSREEATARRKAGYNLVLAANGQWNWWVRANPMGFLLLEKVPLSRLTPPYIRLVSHQPCFFGFVLDKELLHRSPSENDRLLGKLREQRVFIGLELDAPPPSSLPTGLSFLVCPESLLPMLSTTVLPKLVLRESQDNAEQRSVWAAQGAIGWIEQ